MKKTKNILLSVLCVVALLLSAVPTAHAVGKTTISVTDTSVYQSDSFVLYLQISTDDILSALDFLIVYDSDAFTLIEAFPTDLANAEDVSISINNDRSNGLMHTTLVSTNGISGSGILLYLSFQAKNDAAIGEYPITISVNEAFNSALETVTVEKINGTVTVWEQPQIVKHADFSIYAPDYMLVGDSFEYEVNGWWLDGLAAGCFEFTYDTEKLLLTDVVLHHGLDSAVCDINKSINGYVRVSFASNFALPSYEQLLTLKFKAISDGNAEIRFSSSELYDTALTGMISGTHARTVSIALPEPEIDRPDFTIVVPENLNAVRTFEVQAVLEGGSHVRAGDFVINYDKNILECVSVEAKNVSGAWLAVDKTFTDGRIRFSIVSNVDLENDTALLTFKMKAKENVYSKSNITVSGSNISNATFEDVALEYVGAVVEVQDYVAYLLGDANLDGKVNSSDAVLILRYAAKYTDEGFYLDAADYNGDGRVNSTDAVLVLRKAAKLED